MTKVGISPPRSRGQHWRFIVAAILAVMALGGAVPSAHAAVAHTALACSGTPVQPGAISNISGWIGSTDMTVQFTGRTSGCVYSGIVIDTTGTMTNLPTSMVPDTYDVATTHTSTTYVCIPGYTGTATCSLSGTTFVLNSDGSDSIDGNISCSGNLYPVSGKGSSLPVTIGPGEVSGSGGAVATPELQSDQLLAAGLVPTLGLLLYRRRHRGRSKVSDTPDDVVH